MKALFFLINMNLGGTEKSFLNLVSELPKEWQIDLLLLEESGALLSQIPSSVQVKVVSNKERIDEFVRLGPRRFAWNEGKRGRLLSAAKNLGVFLGMKLQLTTHGFWGIKRYLRPLAESYDYAVAYAGIHDFISYYTLKYVRASKKILWIHFDVNKVIYHKAFGNHFYSQFQKICCVSKGAKVEFDKMFPAGVQKSIVFNNIVAQSQLERLAQEGEGFDDGFEGVRILTVGRLSIEKGQDMIPDVVQRLKQLKCPFRWYLIGDGGLRLEIETRIKHLGIEDALILLGSKLNPYSCMGSSDLYVQTSRHEGYCLTIHEAKIFNKAVVTTNVLSASNLINNEENGLIVDISVEGIYQGVKRMLLHPELLKDYAKPLVSRGACEQIEQLFF